MNPEVKDLWTGGLRSGEFTQGKGYLDKDGKQCCLGVLCILAVRAGVEVDVFTDEDGTVSYDGHDLLLPPSVMAWAGLDDENPAVTYVEDGPFGPQSDGLGYVNDEVEGGTFERIAGLIDAQL